MKDKDKEVTKSSALVIADAIASAIHPGVALAWSLSKGFFNAPMKLRENRALEFIEFIKGDPKTFTGAVLNSQEFQDAFVFTLENFLRERSKEKRLLMKRVFSGFTKAIDKSQFPLERYTHTISQLNERDIEALAQVDPNRRGNPNYQIDDVSGKYLQNLYNLIGLGILHDTSNGRTYDRTKDAPFIELSEFGSGLRLYLSE